MKQVFSGSFQQAALILALWAGWIGAAEAAERRPNFMIIIADDLCWRDTGYEGNPDVKTPNLDKLCGESMHLRGMFDPATTCSPTRHALYTGLYNVRSGAFPNHTKVYAGTESLFTELRAAGYRTALQRKADVRPPASFPFEHIKPADDFTETRAFVTRDPAQPWFLVFGSNDPHEPWTRGPQYDPTKLTMPPYLHDDPLTRSLLAKYYGEVSKLDWQVGELMRTLDETGQAKDTMVLFVSEQGGSLPFAGKWTCYDNGIHASSLLRWPGKVAAGSTSTALMQYVDVAPTFLEAAGIDPTKVDVHCPDAHGAKGFDGKSVLPVLLGESDKGRDYVFAQETTLGVYGARQPYPIRAVRDTRYKLVRNLAPGNICWFGGVEKHQPYLFWKTLAERTPQPEPEFAARVESLTKRPAEELYDLQSDPYEFKNVVDDPKLAEVKTRLGTQLDHWMAQQGDRGLATELLAPTRLKKGGGDDGGNDPDGREGDD